MKINRTARGLFIPVIVAMLTPLAPAFAESLEEAAHAALNSHPAIDGAKAEAQAARQEKREQFSNYFPRLSAGTTAGRIYGDNATSRGLSVTRGAGYSGLWNGSVSATEKIFDGFERSNRVDAAKARMSSAKLNLADVRENIVYKTAQAYIDLMRAREGLAMLNGYAKKIDDYTGRILQKVDEGASDEAEHQQARDIRVVLDGLIADYEGQVRAAEFNYFDLTGHAAEGTLIKPAPDEALIPRSLEEALVYARENNPSIHAAIRNSEALSYEAAAEKGPLYPDLEGELSYMKEDKRDLIGGEIEDKRAVVHLNWDFETGGAQLARIKKKKYESKEAMSRARETEKRVELGVRLAYSEYQIAAEQIKNQEKRRELNKKLFETYEAQFEGGKITLLQLMQSDNQLFTTGLEKLNGQYRLLAAKYAILSSMGRLTQSLNLATVADAGPAPASVQPAAGDATGQLTGFDDAAPESR